MGLYPENLNEFVSSMGIPRGPKSNAFLVDPVNGSDSNSGTNWKAPKKTLAAALALCTHDEHDAVLFLSGDTADNPAAAIAWDKDYTHLIGLSSDVYGVGQRCRVVGLAATLLSPVITFSGNGCIIKNMQFNNEKASGAPAGVALLTGSRCYFENVFFMAPTANDAASYSLKITGGSENVFKRCTIGQFTNPRAAASYSLWITGSSLRNKFVDSEFLCWSTSTDHVLVKIATDVTSEGFVTQFEGCLFDNLNGGATLTAAIVDGATETHHQLIMRGSNNTVVGCTAVANPLTYVLVAEKSGTASGLLAATVNES
jgi:hypothetical protein